MQKTNPTMAAGFLTIGVFAYYGTVQYFIGIASGGALLTGLILCGICGAAFLRYSESTGPPEQMDLRNIGIVAVTVAVLYYISFHRYLTTGRLLGSVIGGLAGSLISVNSRQYLLRNRRIPAIVVGIVSFVVLRDISIDVLTMGSRTLEPRIQRGQKVFVNNLSFGFHIPFVPHNVVRWGDPATGDLVVVTGPNWRPYVREVQDTDQSLLLLNIDGWVPRRHLLARANPL